LSGVFHLTKLELSGEKHLTGAVGQLIFKQLLALVKCFSPDKTGAIDFQTITTKMSYILIPNS